MYCQFCGEKIEEGKNYCSSCGKSMANPIEDVTKVKNTPTIPTVNSSRDFNLESEYHKREKSTFIAFLLWLFFGGLGAHRFYAGRWASGLVLLILNITFTIIALVKGPNFFLLNIIPGLWIFIDLFLLRTMVREENYRTRKFVDRNF